MTTDSLTRLLYTILCLVSAVCFPYLLALALIFIGFILFDMYIEGIACVLISDLVFATPLARFHSSLLVGTFIMLAVFIAVAYVKQRTRFHEHF